MYKYEGERVLSPPGLVCDGNIKRNVTELVCEIVDWTLWVWPDSRGWLLCIMVMKIGFRNLRSVSD
jgi:hypothetical protein